ncbi:hypothetical protein GF323_03675 [Candidatus Woesearchaeota archaeon]|nr:hypothetical protein [Candidatus Woesearchaeota archaeon]
MLEQLYPLKLIEKNNLYALLLGIAYSVIGIGLAVLLFPEDPALVAVALISIMFYPTINKLMKQEESIETEQKEFNFMVFLKDHRYVFMIYMLMFSGMLLTFSYFSLLLPKMASNHIFQNQINVMTGNAVAFEGGLFRSLLQNNLIVMIVIFITAMLLGDGGIFLITWNASVWGTIFGNLAKTAAFNANQNPFTYFLIVIGIVSPHMLLEAFSYIVAATTGGVVSNAMIKEKLASKKFNNIATNTVISLAIALIILLIAVAVETYVLGNVEVYKTIIRQSFI